MVKNQSPFKIPQWPNSIHLNFTKADNIEQDWKIKRYNMYFNNINKCKSILNKICLYVQFLNIVNILKHITNYRQNFRRKSKYSYDIMKFYKTNSDFIKQT